MSLQLNRSCVPKWILSLRHCLHSYYSSLSKPKLASELRENGEFVDLSKEMIFTQYIMRGIIAGHQQKKSYIEYIIHFYIDDPQ